MRHIRSIAIIALIATCFIFAWSYDSSALEPEQPGIMAGEDPMTREYTEQW